MYLNHNPPGAFFSEFSYQKLFILLSLNAVILSALNELITVSLRRWSTLIKFQDCEQIY